MDVVLKTSVDHDSGFKLTIQEIVMKKDFVSKCRNDL